MSTLYEISDDLITLHGLLIESGGELTPEIEPIIDAWFEELGLKAEVKIDGYCALIREFEAQLTERKAEADRLAALVKRDRQAATRLKGRLLQFFELHELKKMETRRFSVSVQSNGGLCPIIYHKEAEDLPSSYQQVVIEADTEKIRADLESGKVLDFAELGPRGKHIRIK